MKTPPYDISQFTANGGIVRGQNMNGDWLLDMGGRRFIVPNDPQVPQFSLGGPLPLDRDLPQNYIVVPDATTIPDKVLVFTDEGGRIVGQNADGNWLVDLEGFRFIISPESDGHPFIGRMQISGGMPDEYYPIPDGRNEPPALPVDVPPLIIPITPPTDNHGATVIDDTGLPATEPPDESAGCTQSGGRFDAVTRNCFRPSLPVVEQFPPESDGPVLIGPHAPKPRSMVGPLIGLGLLAWLVSRGR